jgi:uncharacterized phiE125 gp8 family phage protein
MKDGKPLYSLIPLEDFKAVLGVDDRENTLSRFCLIIATCGIEQYCKRRLIRKKHTDYFAFSGKYIFALREYPVRRVLALYTISNEQLAGNNGGLLGPDSYFCLPDEGICEDIPFSLVLRPSPRLLREGMGIRVRYAAGYVPGKAGMSDGVPPDLASACLELAAWNMNRYRGRRIGLDEASMPENVRFLLEVYRRKTI